MKWRKVEEVLSVFGGLMIGQLGQFNTFSNALHVNRGVYAPGREATNSSLNARPEQTEITQSVNGPMVIGSGILRCG